MTPHTKTPSDAKGPRILICGVNWLGDAILSMPAIQAFRAANPHAELVVLAKPSLVPLWALHAAPNRILTLPPDGDSLSGVVRQLRDTAFDAAYVMPHSFRSALPPFLARIPRRIGLPGHFPRNVMLTQVHRPALGPGRTHQIYEYLDLFFPGEKRDAFDYPSLQVAPPVLRRMRDRLAELPQPWIALIPGAARGASKQWPTESYAAAAARLAADTEGSIVVLGTQSEEPICRRVAEAAAPNALQLAGQTSLEELAAILSLSAAVLCNDSGGMHLAAALRTPLAAIFGITNPDQTGPLGQHVRILQRSAVRTRDVPRRSAKAERALRAVAVDDAVQAIRDLLRLTPADL
jgi:heptosyltransferase II